MHTTRQYLGLGQTLVAFALAAAFSPARAQEEPNIAQLTMPGTSVSVGVGVSSGDERDRARFGLFNGLRTHDVNGLLGFSYINRDSASGKWMSLDGRNIGLDNREFGFSYRRLGDLKFTADYGELVRHDPRTINTTLQGAGTTTPIVTISPASGAAMAAPGSGQNLNLELKRKSLGLVLEKQFGNFQLEVNFKNEDKDGSRLFGKGFACSSSWAAAGVAACTGTGTSAVLMLPEPVNSTIRQFEAKLNYSGEKLRLSGGYYGSFYTNNNGTLTPSFVGTRFGNQNGGAAQAADALFLATMGQPMALWPDNQAHQLSLGGNYSVTSHTRVNFKYVYTHATQHESFTGMGLTGAPAGRSDLGGVINTTKAQLGFSSHPLDKLHLHGDLAYESKKNETPLAFYNAFYTCIPPAVYSAATRACAPIGGTATRFYTNGNASPKKWDAKLEASYRLPRNFLLIGGLKYEHEDFGTWTPTDVAGGVSGLKQKLAETSYRVELRKSLSEEFTGSISFVSAKREGKSPWLRPTAFNQVPGGGTGVTEVSDAAIYNRTAIFPFIYMDRKQDKVRMTGTWTPTEKLSLQVFFDDGLDKFSAPTEHGLRNTKMNNLSLDVSYALSDDWKFNGYWSRGKSSRDSGHSTGYDAIVTDTATSFGAGIAGKPTGRLRLGADLVWVHDKLAYSQTADDSSSAGNQALLAGTGGLPDVTYRLFRLNLFGEYAVQKNSYLRLDYIHNRTFFNEWTYNFNGTPYLYSDNTTLNAQEKQSVSFVGLSYVYKFQ